MGNLKTSLEEKSKVINEVIKAFEVLKNEESNKDKKTFFSERIGLINKEKNTDKKYKKALTYNRTYNLGVEVRKTDRFGASKVKVVSEVKEKEDNTNLTSEMETALAPTEAPTSKMDLIGKALAIGVRIFDETFLDNSKVVLKLVGYKESGDAVYLVDGYSQLIEIFKKKSSLIDLEVKEYISSSKVLPFRRGTDEKNGVKLSFGNMVSGYPFKINDVEFDNSECAYICGYFSSNSDKHIELQNELVKCNNGFLAKKNIRYGNKQFARDDWESFNVQWMLYVIWCKVTTNDSFRKLLLATPKDSVLVEDTTFQEQQTAAFWGAKNQTIKDKAKTLKGEWEKQGFTKADITKRVDDLRLKENIGSYKGVNCMGQILMACRDALINGTTPPIDFELLESKNIYLLGNRISFKGESN